MIGRRTVIGLSLLSALLFSAFAVQSASAAISANTTMFTCVDTGEAKTGDFTDAHCDTEGEKGKSQYAHVSISNGSTTKLQATNKTTGVETVATVLKSKVGLVSTEITCNTVESNTENSLAHNEELNGKHTITGLAELKFTNCSVQKPAKCDVVEPIVAKVEMNGVDKLGAGETEMGLEIKGIGAEETFTEMTFTEAECTLKGTTVKLKGSAIGTGKVAQGKKHAGATMVFSPENGMQKLKFGTSEATVTSTVTVTNATSKTPISPTTTT